MMNNTSIPPETEKFVSMNNPFNIKYNPDNRWLGEVPSNTPFCSFKTLKHGYRAFAILMHTYIDKHNIHTVHDFLHRYAPPSDNNNTAAYISFVCGKLGVKPQDNIFPTSDFNAYTVSFASCVAFYESKHQLFNYMFFHIYHSL